VYQVNFNLTFVLFFELPLLPFSYPWFYCASLTHKRVSRGLHESQLATARALSRRVSSEGAARRRFLQDLVLVVACTRR
jgi:hypothetical protein